MSQRRSHRAPLFVLAPLIAAVALGLLVGEVPLAHAQRQIQPPGRGAHAPSKVTEARQARAQRVAPAKVRALGDAIDHRAKALGAGAFRDPSLRSELSTAPLSARLKVFTRAAARRGIKIQTFTRRLRGMVRVGKSHRVVTAKKTFFEVLPETLDLLPQVMGENVIWFGANASPGHLHTMVADQDGGGLFHHNTYGKGPLKDATVPTVEEQYLTPAQLTGPEMDRFVRYVNAGVASTEPGHTTTVYGFRTKSGALVCYTLCTDWATSAPVGDLKRWIRTVDSKVASAARAGALPTNYRGGLHAVLAGKATRATRAQVLRQVLAAPGMTAHTKSLVKRLGREFDRDTAQWPNRPRDLIGRESLADVMGVSRSKDPAKWTYDLMMSKRVPIVGVMHKAPEQDFGNKVLDLEIMGSIGVDGEVFKPENDKKSNQGLGVIPPERRRQGVAAPRAGSQQVGSRGQ